MRLLLILALVLSGLTALWCAMHYIGDEVQLIETRAELRQAQATGLFDSTVDTHIARAHRARRDWGFASLLAAGAALMIVISLMFRRRERI